MLNMEEKSVSIRESSKSLSPKLDETPSTSSVENAVRLFQTRINRWPRAWSFTLHDDRECIREEEGVRRGMAKFSVRWFLYFYFRRFPTSILVDLRPEKVFHEKRREFTITRGKRQTFFRTKGVRMSEPSKKALWSIILAGGEGERTRPFIERWLGYHRPKQYCSFVGNRSMLQHT